MIDNGLDMAGGVIRCIRLGICTNRTKERIASEVMAAAKGVLTAGLWPWRWPWDVIADCIDISITVSLAMKQSCHDLELAKFKIRRYITHEQF